MIKVKKKLLFVLKLQLNIFIIGFGIFMSIASPMISHEMWLDTTTFHPAIGSDIPISLKNGQTFNGIELSYFKNRFSEFYYVNDKQKIEIESRMGDVPAATLSGESNGLITGVYVSKKSTISYKSIQKFASFAAEKGEEWAIQRHIDANLPEDNFKEDYYRFSKILIGVGDANGSDKNVGLQHELIALTNPYIESQSDDFFVKLVFNNKPQENRQITIFERNDEKQVSVQTIFTNSKGIGKFKVTKGNDYLVDNVILELNTNPQNDVYWTSYWAALTFRSFNVSN